MQNSIIALDGVSHETFRDIAALLAMNQFMLEADADDADLPAQVAVLSFNLADAMLAERKKRMPDH